MAYRSLDMLGLSPTPPLSLRSPSEEHSFEDDLDFGIVMPENYAMSYAIRRAQAAQNATHIEDLAPLSRQSSRRDGESKESTSSKRWPWLERPKALVSSLLGRKDSAMKDDSAASLMIGQPDEEASDVGSIETARKAFDRPDDSSRFWDSDVLYDDFSENSSKIGANWEDAPSDDNFYGDAMVAAIKSAEARGEYREDIREARFKHTLHATTTEQAQLVAAGELRQYYTKLNSTSPR